MSDLPKTMHGVWLIGHGDMDMLDIRQDIPVPVPGTRDVLVRVAAGRTVLANDRTLLGFIRTALGLLGGGIGLVSYLKHPVIVTVGWLSMALSVVLLFWGIWRYIQIRRMMIEFSRQNK